MPTRFVILHHRLENSEHWDLMLEHGEVLLTWQLPIEPTGLACFPISATRIADHRKTYLTYEGPISGNRGTVRSIESGTVTITELSEQECRFTLDGPRLSGDFTLSPGPGSTWTFRLA